MLGTVWHHLPVTGLAALTLRNRNRYRRLADIQPNERAILHVPPPIPEARNRPVRRNPHTENAAEEAIGLVTSQRDHGV